MQATQHYDPRPKTSVDSEESLSGIIWSSQSMQWALDSIKLGQKLPHSPFYEGNVDLRKGNLVFQYSEWEYEEIIKCSTNIVYFIETYCKVKRPDGKIGNIKLRPYQFKQIQDYLDFDEIILGWSRQSGKTIGTALYILWAMIFNADKQTALLANKSGTSKEVLDKVKGIYKHLPFFLKPGILGINNSVLAFDNGCTIYTGPATLDALNGKTCNLLYIDEFAYVGKGKNKIEYQKEFLANAKPVLSSQKDSGLCKLIISSTPVGKEYFFKLFSDAMIGKNKMKASKVCWWEIPGKSIQWAKDEIATMGISKFKVQYEMSFDVHAETLLDSRTMKRLMVRKKSFKPDMFDVLSNYENYLMFDPEVEIDTEFDVFCLSVDIAEGLGQDFSTIQILRLDFDEEKYTFNYTQVGMFACNTISIEDFAVVTRELFHTLNPEYSKLLVEQNTYGDYFFKCLNDDESEEEIPIEAICKFKRSSDAEHKTKGLRTNKEIKKIAVKSFKSITDMNQLIVKEETTISEIENFQKTAKETYEASVGHDDKVTPLINFAYWVNLKENEYQFWVEEFCELNGIDYSAENKPSNDFKRKIKEEEIDEALLPDDVKEFLS